MPELFGGARYKTMLLTIAVLVLAAAAIMLVSSKRARSQFPSTPPSSLDPPAGARPLFAPSEAEVVVERQKQESIEIARREARARFAAREKVDAALLAFRDHKDKHSTAELLRAAAEDGMNGDLARAAAEVIKVFQENGIAGLTPSDLAALIDSHISLLPDNERGSGASFWLKQEVASLRER